MKVKSTLGFYAPISRRKFRFLCLESIRFSFGFCLEFGVEVEAVLGRTSTLLKSCFDG